MRMSCATKGRSTTPRPCWCRRATSGLHWPAPLRAMGAIRRLRDEAPDDPNALNYKLLHGGFVDGGIDNQGAEADPEYSNIHWTLAGMNSFIAAAHWLGYEADASAAQ